MTKIQKALGELIYNMTWKEEWFTQDISEKEMQQLAKLAKIMQNKYEHSSKQKSSLLAKFQASNYEYIREIDRERDDSRCTVKTKDGKTLLYAKFDETYKINPTDAKQYVNQYQT